MCTKEYSNRWKLGSFTAFTFRIQLSEVPQPGGYNCCPPTINTSIPLPWAIREIIELSNNGAFMRFGPDGIKKDQKMCIHTWMHHLWPSTAIRLAINFSLIISDIYVIFDRKSTFPCVGKYILRGQPVQPKGTRLLRRHSKGLPF